MTGEEKAREVADKIKADVEANKAKVAEEKGVALNQLAVIGQNAQLAKMYSENAQVGADNLAGELPLLKVHATGRSLNTLADGTEPQDGWFFYRPTGEQFETLECHILTISKGFRAEGMEGKKNVFNQILGGVIKDKGLTKPFIMYMTGLKLSYLWEFGKDAKKYTHAKPIPIPMFALTIKLTTEKIKNNYGKSWIIKFEIKKSQDGTPELVMDPGEFQFLKDNVSMIEDTIASLIEARASKEDEDAPATPLKEVHEATEAPSDIPF